LKCRCVSPANNYLGLQQATAVRIKRHLTLSWCHYRSPLTLSSASRRPKMKSKLTSCGTEREKLQLSTRTCFGSKRRALFYKVQLTMLHLGAIMQQRSRHLHLVGSLLSLALDLTATERRLKTEAQIRNSVRFAWLLRRSSKECRRGRTSCSS
jgi:hypothetical protein